MAIQEDMATDEEAKINTILTCFPHEKSLESLVFIPRFRQRLSILSKWSILPGSRVLDIGCGQGDSSLALALELGPACHVTGIDTAPPDYGTPMNVAQSQEKILQSPLGNRLAFQNEVDAATFFKSKKPVVDKFDAATACHSLFYFPSYSSVASLFQELASAGVEKVYVAEYDQKQTPSFPASQTPHILAAKAQALYYGYKAEADADAADAALALSQKEQHDNQQLHVGHISPKNGEQPLNIRAAPDVESITRAAKEGGGFRVKRQGKFTPGEDYLEGHFETRYVRGPRFEARVKEEEFAKEREEEILGVIEEVRRAYEKMEKGGVEKVRCMSVWWAEFELE